MGSVIQSPQITDLNDQSEKFRYIQLCLQGIVSQVNGNIEFLKNMKAKQVEVVFSAANTNTAVQHGLGYVPNGYIVYRLSAAMIVYDGTGTNSTSVISLKSSATGTAKILIF